MATEIAASNSQKRARMLSLDLASKLFDWSSIALAIGACIVFVATAAIVWLGIVKEHHWDELRERANEKIAAVELEAANSNAEAAKAHERIAELSLQAEQLRKQTAELTAANLALELQFQPRRWNKQEDAIAFGASLARFNGKTVKVASQLGEVEGGTLANQIIFGLQKGSKINVVDRKMTIALLGIVVIGVLVSGDDRELVDAIVAALPAHLKAATSDGLPATGAGMLVPDPPGHIDATIWVGGKPLPDP